MNLELLPASLNRSKSDKITDRARVFAKELYDAGLLSEEGLKAVEAEYGLIFSKKNIGGG